MKIRPPLPGIGAAGDVVCAATVEERTWAGTLCAFPGECSPGSREAGVFVAPLPPGFSDRVSSAAPINAMAAPMGAELPSETSILRSVPLAKASISMLTLSVSTSASISPFFTGSPSFLIQRRILPSSIVSPILGISTFFIYQSPLLLAHQDGRHYGFHRLDNIALLGESGAFQDF